MPKKRKTKQQISITWILGAVISVITIILLITLVYFLVKGFVEERNDQQFLREQKVRLDAAEKDLNSIADEFLSRLSSDEVNKRSSYKECGESSAKYGRGTITCGPGFFIRVYSQQSLTMLREGEHRLLTITTSNKAFTSMRQPYIDDGEYVNGRLFSLDVTYKDISRMECDFSLYTFTPEQYIREFKNEDPQGKNVLTLHGSCNETAKEPIYPLVKSNS